MKCQIYFSKSAYNEIFFDVKKDNYETFGIMLGKKNGYDYYISHIIDEGIEAKRSVARLEFDDKYINYRLSRYLKMFDVDFLGIYHKHPPGVEKFSFEDYKTMSKFHKVVGKPYLSFLAFDVPEGITFSPFVFDGKEARPISIKISILDDTKLFEVADIKENVIHYTPSDDINIYIRFGDLKRLLKNKKLYFENRGNNKNIVVKPVKLSKNYIKGLDNEFFELKIDNDYFLIHKKQIKILSLNPIEERANGIVSIKKLSNKRVLVVGAGSVGGAVAVNLARLGVGNIDIVDFDILELHNPFRHEVGFNMLGVNKAEALKHRIENLNPFVNVSAYTSSFEDFKNGSFLFEEKQYDLIVCAVDNRVGQLEISNFAKRMKTPFVSIALHPGGEVGEIFVYIPGLTEDYENFLEKVGISQDDLEEEKSIIRKRFYVSQDTVDAEEEIFPVIYTQILRVVSFGIDVCLKILENKDMNDIIYNNLIVIENNLFSNFGVWFDKV